MIPQEVGIVRYSFGLSFWHSNPLLYKEKSPLTQHNKSAATPTALKMSTAITEVNATNLLIERVKEIDTIIEKESVQVW